MSFNARWVYNVNSILYIILEGKTNETKDLERRRLNTLSGATRPKDEAAESDVMESWSDEQTILFYTRC